MPSLRESTTAVIVRGETITDGYASEPYEAGWALEAVLFVRCIDDDAPRGGHVHVQVSPDGMHWADEGAAVRLADAAVSFVRIAHFGNWLRLRAELPAGQKLRLLATLHLKG